MPKFYTRIHPRWDRCDYRLPGIYFVTAVTHERAPLLGTLRGGRYAFSPSGLIVRDTWQRIPERIPAVELDTFVVMPDHVHALIALHERPEPEATPLSQIVGWAKSRSAHTINVMRGMPGCKVWQTNFHDSIVRSSEAVYRIRNYINSNPRRASRNGGA